MNEKNNEISEGQSRKGETQQVEPKKLDKHGNPLPDIPVKNPVRHTKRQRKRR